MQPVMSKEDAIARQRLYTELLCALEGETPKPERDLELFERATGIPFVRKS